jgi:probable addiction module antidote protein
MLSPISHSGLKSVQKELSVPSEQGFDLTKYRDNPAAIAECLNRAFAKNDLKDIVYALKSVMQAQNVKALSEATGMRRDGLYKTFNGKKDPQLGRILSLFDGLDIRIVVEALPTKEKPPRPKLGRPLSATKAV